MKVTIDMENLSEIVQSAATENVKDAVENAIKQVVREKVDECLKEQAENSINDAIHAYVDQYLSETKITVGNSWDGDGVKEYTLEEYLKQKVQAVFEKQVFTVTEHDSWRDRDTRKEVSFKDYIDQRVNVDSEIQKRMNSFTAEVKRRVNNNVKNTLDESMKSALTDSIFAMLSSGQTYQTIMRNVQLLGDGNE